MPPLQPHTWREILQAIDRYVPIANHTIGLQEYGEPNASLLAGLEARGATVITLRLYHWDLPEDTTELSAALKQIADGRIDAALFTTSHQLVNVLNLAQRTGMAEQVRQGLRAAVIGSIGPDTSAMIRQHDLPVDVQPEHPTMAALVNAVAEDAAELLSKKRWLAKAAPNLKQARGEAPAIDPNDPA